MERLDEGNPRVFAAAAGSPDRPQFLANSTILGQSGFASASLEDYERNKPRATSTGVPRLMTTFIAMAGFNRATSSAWR